MDQSVLRSFEAGCVQEEPPGCQTMCPLHVDARAFAALMGQGRTADARKLLDRNMPLAMLLGRLCSGPCLAHCRRAEIDGAVNLPLLERACVNATKSAKIMPLPATGRKTAVFGSGLSSLVAAFELARKGHAVTLFHHPAGPGKTLAEAAGDRLAPDSADIVEEALNVLRGMRVVFVPLDAVPPAGDLAGAHDAVYLGQDDPSCDFSGLGLGSGSFSRDALTGGTEIPTVFAGGHADNGVLSFIEAAAQGRLAAGSITRILQGVAPGSARESDVPYPSRLYTNISGVPPAPAIVPADPQNPSPEEAKAEGARCIRCECMECVKNCAFLRHFKGYPKKYAREMYNNLAVVQGHRQANLLINSCADCGLCAQICPHNTDTGAFAAPLRRELVRAGVMPPSAHEFALEDLAFANAPDMAFFRHQPGKETSRYAFFPGCQLPASHPGETASAYAYLGANLDGGVGLFFACCGAPARWAGQEAMTGRILADFRGQWEQAGKPRLIVACASCALFFREALPDLPLVTLWETLDSLPLPPEAAISGGTLALHDPCASRHDTAARASVRALLGKTGQALEEFALGGEMTRCCGYGGLADAANPPLGEAFVRDRAADTPHPILSYCSMCRDRIRAAGKESIHLLSLLFPRGAAEKALLRPAPGISDRQEARLAFRDAVLRDVWGETTQRSPLMDGTAITIPEDVAEAMEKRRILRSDIAHVLGHAETTRFRNPETGRFLACLRPRQVTFWVEYSRDGNGGYILHNAYTHRMVVPGVPDMAPGELDALPAPACRCKDITGCGERRGK